jgi:hypothetical protein
MHVHVISGGAEGKYWLRPELELAKNYRFSSQQLREIEAILEEHYNELVSAWEEHFHR